MSTPSKEQLQRAIEIQEEIARLELEMRAILSGSGTAVASPQSVARKSKVKPPKTKRTRSPETRARMAAAQQKRWAKAKKPDK